MLQTFFDVRRWFETHCAASFNVDDVARLRISTLAGFAGSYGKGAEPGNLESFTLLDRLGDTYEGRIHFFTRCSFADVFAFRHRVDELTFSHCLLLLHASCSFGMIVQKQVEIIMDSS